MSSALNASGADLSCGMCYSGFLPSFHGCTALLLVDAALLVALQFMLITCCTVVWTHPVNVSSWVVEIIYGEVGLARRFRG